MLTSCSVATAVKYISEGDCFEEQYSSQSATFGAVCKDITLVHRYEHIYLLFYLFGNSGKFFLLV